MEKTETIGFELPAADDERVYSGADVREQQFLECSAFAKDLVKSHNALQLYQALY